MVDNAVMNSLAEIMQNEIRERGPLTFARFMEIALYHPTLGYYERRTQTIGRAGDFFTSVSVGNLFGELLAFQFAEWLEELPFHRADSITTVASAGDLIRSSSRPSSADRTVQLVEAGAHDGRLALDILTWFRQRQPKLLQRLEYWVLEPSAERQERQARALREFKEHVRWFPSWDSISRKRICGVIFANELLDAFPAHRFGWNAGARRWFEWGVTWQEGHFAWAQLPQGLASMEDAPPPLSWPDPPRELLAVLPDGFTTERSSAGETWWEKAAHTLERGKLLTIDYGLRAEEFFTPERADGTLRAYHRHQWSSNLLERVGEQDLTFHVNFTALQEKGEQAGLRTEAFMPQAKFLMDIVAKINRSPQTMDAWTPARVRQLQTLVHPEHLGRPFRALIQSR